LKVKIFVCGDQRIALSNIQMTSPGQSLLFMAKNPIREMPQRNAHLTALGF
jgi:hypothetical protein